MVVVRVLEDGLDVDDVLARGRPPVEVDLPPTFGIVFQHFERKLLSGRLLDALHDLAVDAEAEDRV